MLDLFNVLCLVCFFGGSLLACISFHYFDQAQNGVKSFIFGLLSVVFVLITFFPVSCDNSMKQIVLHVYDVQEVQDLPEVSNVDEAIENIKFMYDINSEKKLSVKEVRQINKYLKKAYENQNLNAFHGVDIKDIDEDQCTYNDWSHEDLVPNGNGDTLIVFYYGADRELCLKDVIHHDLASLKTFSLKTNDHDYDYWSDGDKAQKFAKKIIRKHL